ncbi:MAG: hypothetical protein R3F34_17885 [Planctomycetota bacterium]
MSPWKSVPTSSTCAAPSVEPTPKVPNTSRSPSSSTLWPLPFPAPLPLPAPSFSTVASSFHAPSASRRKSTTAPAPRANWSLPGTPTASRSPSRSCADPNASFEARTAGRTEPAKLHAPPALRTYSCIPPPAAATVGSLASPTKIESPSIETETPKKAWSEGCGESNRATWSHVPFVCFSKT